MSDEDSYNDSHLQFWEREISMRDEKIRHLESKFEAALKDGAMVKTELAAAKSYILSLPTREELAKLKQSFADSREESKQLSLDLRRAKGKNSELIREISTLQTTVIELKSTLQNKCAEVDALRYTVQLWEQRRKAAREAGQLTVEDVLAEKMKLESHLQDVLKIAVCREQHLKARIDTMKAHCEEQERTVRAHKKENETLNLKINQLKATLGEAKDKYETLDKSKEELELKIVSLSTKLIDLQTRENNREKANSCLNECIADISQCHEAVTRMLDFIRNAMRSNFLDPSLLFFPIEDDPIARHIDDEDFKKEAEDRLNEVRLLKENLKECQKLISDLYVANLSSSVSNNCHIQ